MRKPGALVFGLFLCAAMLGSARAQEESATELDLIRQQIRQTKAHTAVQVAAQYRTYPRLAEDYLRAHAPLLTGGSAFSVQVHVGWSGSDGRGAALHRSIERDMREWHPVFMLTFLETLLERRHEQLYVTMLNLPGRSIGAAYEKHLRDRAVTLQDAGAGHEAAQRIAEAQLAAESTRLWQAMASVAEDNIVRILAQALAVDPVSARLNAVPRVQGVLDIVASDGLYWFLHQRVCEGPGSPTLPDSIHGAIDRVLLEADLETTWKERKFSELLELFVSLQNRGARDNLLLIFDDFGKYDKILGDRRLVFGDTLNQKVVRFVEASQALDPQAELALDVVDQLTKWVVEKVWLEDPQLSHQRVLDVLCLLEERRPAILPAYIRRFYRDFHAFNPAGYETVILHLTGIFIDFALAGPVPDVDPYPRETVIQVLRWYNRSLAEVGPTLPTVGFRFVEDEQREVIAKIYACFDVVLNRERPLDDATDRRVIETLLLLFGRVADLADPDEVRERLVVPLVGAGVLRADPLLEFNIHRLTDMMRPATSHAAARGRRVR